jgi:hypothetical protein
VGSEADAYIDLVYVVNGRAAFVMEGFDILSPFNTDQLQQFTKQALARVQQTIPAR